METYKEKLKNKSKSELFVRLIKNTKSNIKGIFTGVELLKNLHESSEVKDEKKLFDLYDKTLDFCGFSLRNKVYRLSYDYAENKIKEFVRLSADKYQLFAYDQTDLAEILANAYLDTMERKKPFSVFEYRFTSCKPRKNLTPVEKFSIIGDRTKLFDKIYFLDAHEFILPDGTLSEEGMEYGKALAEGMPNYPRDREFWRFSYKTCTHFDNITSEIKSLAMELNEILNDVDSLWRDFFFGPGRERKIAMKKAPDKVAIKNYMIRIEKLVTAFKSIDAQLSFLLVVKESIKEKP